MNELIAEIIYIINDCIKENYLDKENNNDEISFQEIDIQQKDEDLTQLGMDSIAFIHIIIAIEEKYDVEIPDEFLLMHQLNTIAKIDKVVRFILMTKN